MLRTAGCTKAEPTRLNRMMLMGQLPRLPKDASGRLLYTVEWVEKAKGVLLPSIDKGTEQE